MIPPAAIAGRYVFYNSSYWDGNNAAANADDDAAIAPDKQALIREVLTWYKRHHPIWFEWLEIA